MIVKDFMRKSLKNTLKDIICGVMALLSMVAFMGSLILVVWGLLSGVNFLVGVDVDTETLLNNNSIFIPLVCVVCAVIAIFCHNCIEIFKKHVERKLDKWIKTSETFENFQTNAEQLKA